MWLGASPAEPRSSGIGLLLPRGSGFFHRPLRRLRRHLPTSGEEEPLSFGNEMVDLRRRQVVVVLVVEPHHGRVLAGAKALDLLVAEDTVGGDLLRRAHSDRRLQVIHHLVRAAQHAAEVRAHVETVLADRLEVKERVEGRHALDVAWVELQRLSDLAHRLGRQVAELFLGQVERRHHRGARLRVFRRQLPYFFQDAWRESRHRSQSPSTASAVPMIATMSATMWLSAIRSSACRLTNEAERNLTRRGLCVPSLTT